MIDILFEQRVIQNTGLAAETIWYTVNETYMMKGRTEGVSFPLIFIILPLTFHLRTANVLASKNKPGAIYKALADDREIIIGLQHRMESLSARTLQALSIGFSTGLLLFDRDYQHQLVPGKKQPPVTHITEEVRIITKAAKRVGQSFAELQLVQIATALGVTF